MVPRALLVALVVEGSDGIRRGKQAPGASSANTFIAGVPVFNVYDGASVEKFDAAKEWNLVVKSGVTDEQIQQLCDAAPRGCKRQGHPSQGGVPFLELRATAEELEGVISPFQRLVKFIEPDTLVQAVPELSGEAPEGQSPWGLERVRASQRSSEGTGVSVFIFDTGVRPTHTDFGGRVVPALDLTSGEAPEECNGDFSCALDRDGHGTHCAGTAAGSTYGVASQATIRSVKTLDDGGNGLFSWIYAGLDWAATRTDIRPAVVSMSLGGPGTQEATRDAIDAAIGAGLTVVVAAGNSAGDACKYSPAFVPSAITVGSTDSTDWRSLFSSSGTCTNIWAPGSDVLSAGVDSDTDSSTNSGTSMACPHVAGAAALVLGRNPGYNSAKVRQALLESAEKEQLYGLKDGDTNAMVYVGAGGAPALPPRPPAPCGANTFGPPDKWGTCRCFHSNTNPIKCYRNGVLGCPVHYSHAPQAYYFNLEMCGAECECKPSK